MKNGYFRVGACTPKLRVANPKENAEYILEAIKDAVSKGISLLVFPELCITGYTCSDLFLQKQLQDFAIDALLYLVDQTKETPIIFAVGIPLANNNKLYNCAAIITGGHILGFVPKTNLPNYAEFYECRHFSPGPANGSIYIRGKAYPFGTNQLFICDEFDTCRFAVEICEDLWVPIPPSSHHAEMGATLILNLSASDETISKAAYRRSLISSQSARLICGYVYADAGFGESTTDMVFAGHNLIYENGRILSESNLFSSGIIFQDIDFELLAQDRIRQSSYRNITEDEDRNQYVQTHYSLSLQDTKTIRVCNPYPFVPSDILERNARCEEIYSIQATGLATRLAHTGITQVVIGMSGGLDSTLAFLVAIRAFTLLNLPFSGIHAITMPGFGTTTRTYGNACKLSAAYHTSFEEIPIDKAVIQHFADIKQDPNTYDITYENSQARERTQILMDLANKYCGLVIGTGDLSELALGFATYNGDHMSMYAVNASVPKTLVRYLVMYAAGISEDDVKQVLLDVLDTPVSPELLPHNNDKISQVTEDFVGPYALHDFFLYYFIRHGFSPEKLYDMAVLSFEKEYDAKTIQKWCRLFIKRFFSQQFKRSCLPDGPKVGSVSLSPRGDWRMPSDASSFIWTLQD